MTLEPGVLLNQRYRISQLHKLGLYGAVYRAIDTVQSIVVAVKQNLIADPAIQHQFMKEAVFLSNLRHSNIPRAIDCFTCDDSQFFVMDFIEGENLEDWMVHAHLPASELIPLLRGIFQALIYIHSRKPAIIHKDIQPSNIILSSSSTTYLVDFGFAMALEAGSITGQRSDQYLLAATIYTLLARCKPADSLERSFGYQAYKPARLLNPAIPVHVDAALERAMALQARDRYPNIEAFWHAFYFEGGF